MCFLWQLYVSLGQKWNILVITRKSMAAVLSVLLQLEVPWLKIKFAACRGLCVAVYDVTGSTSDRNCVVLNDIHIDIMDYIVPATCTDTEFRQMWMEFEWENKVAVNTNISDLHEYMQHLIKATNMKCLTPEKVMSLPFLSSLLFGMGWPAELKSLYSLCCTVSPQCFILLLIQYSDVNILVPNIKCVSKTFVGVFILSKR